MEAVYKFPLPIIEGTIVTSIPEEATLLTIQVQNSLPTIWALVNLDRASSGHVKAFRIVATGEEIMTGSGLIYVGTVQIDIFVWHIFEVVA